MFFYINIIFLPLLSFFISSFFGRWLGKGAAYVTIFGMILSCFFSFIIFAEVGFSKLPYFIKLLTWFNNEFLLANWGLLFDSLSIMMLIVVTFISTLVHLYSFEYMSHDPHLPRFMAYLSLFTFFMLILVTSDNFIQLFVGWEGVGLCSFLLINFWFTRIQANKAAIKAMIINRIGDFGLALGIFCLYSVFNSVEYQIIFSLTPFYQNFIINFFNFNISFLNLVCILLFIGAIGKSAQLGLHTWLPDAMEGPTPVSALIHAATMVTAGVFLLARCSPIFEYAPIALFTICFIGASTAFFAATTGLLQNDLKRVIAYSTCSQLGYMIFACGLSNYFVGVFHLANHAFFKALLFLSAGSIIHAVADEQDIRKMGGLKKIIPFTFTVMTIGSFALMGFPFLTGFYSKDIILETAFSTFNLTGHYCYWMGAIGAFFTAFYSIRLLYLTFLNNTNGNRTIILNVSESNIFMSLPLFLLTFPSIFIGYLGKDLFIGFGTNFWFNSIFVFSTNINLIDAEFIPQFYKLVPLIFSFFGMFSAFVLYKFYNLNLFRSKISSNGYFLYNFLNKKWFFDKIYNEYLNQFFLYFSFFVTYKNIDRGIIEVIGPFGISHFISNLSLILTKFHKGNFYYYLIYIIFLIFLLSFAENLFLSIFDFNLLVICVLTFFFF